MRNDLTIKPSVSDMLRDATEQTIELEAELERERARRLDLANMIAVLTTELALSGSISLKQFMDIQGYTAAGHA